MVPVFPLLFATCLPGRIQAKVRHPMLAAVKLWAFADLLALVPPLPRWNVTAGALRRGLPRAQSAEGEWLHRRAV
jgi:hypothetical protein